MIMGLALGVAAVGCSKNDVSGCEVNADCPSGDICKDGVCYELCDDDLDCVVGFVCNGTYCERGKRLPPTIDHVTGNGSASCPQAEDGLCFTNGLVVYGTNLAGSAFSLNSTTGGASYSLAPGTRREDTRMDVLLPLDLVADTYLLVAMNSAGEAQLITNILQGEPANMTGDQVVDRVNQAPYTSRFVTQRMPVANDLIAHLNTGSSQLDPAILPPGGGNYTGNDIVSLINTGATSQINTARLVVGTTAGTVATGDHTHGPSAGSQLHMQRTAGTAGSAVLVDDTTLVSLCGDADGCDMRVGYRYFSAPTGLVRAILYGPPCRFHLDSSRNWAVAPDCLQRYEVNNGGGTEFHQPYASGGYGTDGSTGDGGPSWNVIEYYANGVPVCTLAEANVPSGASDTTNGFYFWMTTSAAGGTFTDASRTCELIIAD